MMYFLNRWPDRGLFLTNLYYFQKKNWTLLNQAKKNSISLFDRSSSKKMSLFINKRSWFKVYWENFNESFCQTKWQIGLSSKLWVRQTSESKTKLFISGGAFGGFTLNSTCRSLILAKICLTKYHVFTLMLQMCNVRPMFRSLKSWFLDLFLP